MEASPKRDGNSVTLAKEFIKGLRENSSAEVTELYLEDMDIKFCRGCWSCLKLGESGCVIKDDMTTTYPKLNEADLIVFATPIYWWHINAQMKKFIDRLEGFLNGNGLNNLSGKTLALILSYNMEDPDGVYLAIQMFRSIAGWSGMDLRVLKYNATQGHVSGDPEKLLEAYDLGASLSNFERYARSLQCPVESCNGMFASDEALARHLATAAEPSHSNWRRGHGFADLGIRTDELWMGIAEKMRENH